MRIFWHLFTHSGLDILAPSPASFFAETLRTCSPSLTINQDLSSPPRSKFLQQYGGSQARRVHCALGTNGSPHLAPLAPTSTGAFGSSAHTTPKPFGINQDQHQSRADIIVARLAASKPERLDATKGAVARVDPPANQGRTTGLLTFGFILIPTSLKPYL